MSEWDARSEEFAFIRSAELKSLLNATSVQARILINHADRAALAVGILGEIAPEIERKRRAAISTWNGRRPGHKPEQERLAVGKYEVASAVVGVSVTYLTAFVQVKNKRPDLYERVLSGELPLSTARKMLNTTKQGTLRRKPTDPSRALARAVLGLEGYLALLEPLAEQLTECDRESLRPLISRLRKLTQPRRLHSVAEN